MDCFVNVILMVNKLLVTHGSVLISMVLGWFVGCTGCTLQNLLCLACERFLCLCSWNPYL